MHEKLTAEIKMDGADHGIELGDGEFLAVMSDPTLDRDGEIIDPGAFEPLPAKINVDIDHNTSVLATVGSGFPFYSGEKLMIRAKFASTPTAQEVRTLVTEGHIDRMSVRFKDARRQPDDKGIPHVVKAELLNVGIVQIPANDSAAILAAKAAEDVARGAVTPNQARKLLGLDPIGQTGPTEVLVLDRPDSIAEAAADDWSAAVTEFARSWTPAEAKDGDDEEISTDVAPEAAASEGAADKAADLEAAARQRRRAVERQKASMALASTPT